LFNFLDLNLDLLLGQFFQARANNLHVVALATDDDTGLGGEDRHDKLLRIALDLDLRDASAFSLLADELPNAEVLVQVFRVACSFGKPTPFPGTVDLQTEPNWVYFAPHSLVLTLIENYGNMRGSLDTGLITPTRASLHPLHGQSFVRKDRLDIKIFRIQLE